MPKADDTPDTLRPFLFHGIQLEINGKEATADCPFCGHDDSKFGIKVETGQYNCFSCNEKGEKFQFIRRLWELSDLATKDYKELAGDRGVNVETLAQWGAAKSITTGDWLVPGYGADGKLNQLYRFVFMKSDNKKRLMPTPTIGHALYGVNLFDKKKQLVYLCEGVWNGMALWQALSQAKEVDNRANGVLGMELASTSNAAMSLLSQSNVLAVPGCKVFFEIWLPLFAGKDVVLLYDSDHPKKNPKTGQDIPPAGYAGLERAARMMTSSANPPSSIRYLKWGENGYDESKPTGYDVRDVLKGTEKAPTSPVARLEGLVRGLHPVPEVWLVDAKKAKSGTSHGKNKEMELLPCRTWKELISAWRKALTWTDGLDRALSVMLASVSSTDSLGDQLWIKLVSPPSTAKSTLAEALSTSRKYVFPTDTFTGLSSGYQVDAEGSENLSLIHRIAGKTLIINDGDTLMKLPNMETVLSELRAFYGGNFRAQYKNKMSAANEGKRCTIILCGTEALRRIDQSELGERFLDCVIMVGIDDELEDEILLRVAHRADRSMSYKADGKLETLQEPEMTKAMQLTGGYVEYIRENAQDLLSKVTMTDEAKLHCTRLGKFVAHMRARPSDKQDENAEREFAARLVSQHVRLAKCLAIVLNRKTTDKEVMRRTRQVALDTSRGVTLDVVKLLYEAGTLGAEIKGLESGTNRTQDRLRTLLRFLRQIGVVETWSVPGKITAKPKWRLTGRMRTLFAEVYGESEKEHVRQP